MISILGKSKVHFLYALGHNMFRGRAGPSLVMNQQARPLAFLQKQWLVGVRSSAPTILTWGKPKRHRNARIPRTVKSPFPGRGASRRRRGA